MIIVAAMIRVITTATAPPVMVSIGSSEVESDDTRGLVRTSRGTARMHDNNHTDLR